MSTNAPTKYSSEVDRPATNNNNSSTGIVSTNHQKSHPERNENIYHYAGKVHVRGLLRRVWRPRYLALGDDGYLRYHESIPPMLQQQAQPDHGRYNMAHHTHRPKNILAILDGARVIHPYSVLDQHVALPEGVYGFVFRARPVELTMSSTIGNDVSCTRDDLYLDKHKPAKAVVNAFFPKGTSRRKTAQKLAKAAINPDVCSIVQRCERGLDNSDSSSSMMGYEQALSNEDEIDHTNVVQVHVQSSTIQSREYLCAVSSASEAESWVVALRWASERRRINKEEKRLRLQNIVLGNEVKFNSLHNEGDDKLVITGAIDDNEVGDANDYGKDSKESLSSTVTEGSWCKTEVEKRSSDQESQSTWQDVPKTTNVLDEDPKRSSTSPAILQDDDLAEENNDSTLMYTSKAKTLLDSLLVEKVVAGVPPSKLFEERQTTQVGDGAAIVITKVRGIQLHCITATSQNIPIPLPGNTLDIRYEIDMLLLTDFETTDTAINCEGLKHTDNLVNNTGLYPKSIEERTLFKSAQDILTLICKLKNAFGESNKTYNSEMHQASTCQLETVQFLEEIYSTLLIGLDVRMKEKSTYGFLSVTSEIIATTSGVNATAVVVNRIMRLLSTHHIVCSSKHFQRFLGVGGSACSSKQNNRVKPKPYLDGENIDQIVQTWLSMNKSHQLGDAISLYIAVTLRHSIGGPVLFSLALWVALRCTCILWCMLSKRFAIIPIPLETYVTLIVAAFYYGHRIGTRSPHRESDVLGIRKGRITRQISTHIHSKSTSSLTGEQLVEDNDDHSTLIDEMHDSESAFIISKVESNDLQSTVLSSPLPMFPQNKAKSCWSKPDDTIFMVRSKSYLSNRLKMPSAPAVFECRGVDIWLTDNAERNISRHPSILGGKLHEKDTFIVNFLLPFANFVAYFDIKPLDQMPRNVAKVWQAFLNGDQEYRDRKLKLLPVVIDGPWIVKKAVGPGTSPAMIGRDLPLQYYFTEPTATKKGVYEVDILVTASRIARGILNVVKGHLQSLTIAFAFIVEATEYGDLPETVLCAFQVHSVHLEDCPCLPKYSHFDPSD